MDRRGFFRGLGSGTLGMVLAPQVLSQLIEKSSGGIPVPTKLSSADIPCPNITAVGVGPLGAKMIRILVHHLNGIKCHEVCLDPEILGETDLPDICSCIRSSDLVFLMSGQEDLETIALFKSLGASALEVGALVVGIVPEEEWSMFTSLETMTEAPIVLDICLTVPKVCFYCDDETGISKKTRRLALIEYTMDYTAAPISSITTKDSIGVIIRTWSVP